MKINLHYEYHSSNYIIIEDELMYTVPFHIIFQLGRKLIYYSDKNSSTPVRDWYENLNEVLKKEILIEDAPGHHS